MPVGKDFSYKPHERCKISLLRVVSTEKRGEISKKLKNLSASQAQRSQTPGSKRGHSAFRLFSTLGAMNRTLPIMGSLCLPRLSPLPSPKQRQERHLRRPEGLIKIAGLVSCVGCVNLLYYMVCVIGKGPGGAAAGDWRLVRRRNTGFLQVCWLLC